MVFQNLKFFKKRVRETMTGILHFIVSLVYFMLNNLYEINSLTANYLKVIFSVMIQE